MELTSETGNTLRSVLSQIASQSKQETQHELEIQGGEGESVVSQGLIHKGFENSVDFNVVLPKPPAHSAQPSVIAIKPGHSREKNRVKAATGKNMNIRKRVTAGNRVRGHGPCCNFV